MLHIDVWLSLNTIASILICSIILSRYYIYVISVLVVDISVLSSAIHVLSRHLSLSFSGKVNSITGGYDTVLCAGRVTPSCKK